MLGQAIELSAIRSRNGGFSTCAGVGADQMSAGPDPARATLANAGRPEAAGAKAERAEAAGARPGASERAEQANATASPDNAIAEAERDGFDRPIISARIAPPGWASRRSPARS